MQILAVNGNVSSYWVHWPVCNLQTVKFTKQITIVGTTFVKHLSLQIIIFPIPCQDAPCPQSLELKSMRTGGSSWPQVNPACPLTLPHNHYTQSTCLVGILGWKHGQMGANCPWNRSFLMPSWPSWWSWTRPPSFAHCSHCEDDVFLLQCLILTSKCSKWQFWWR